MFFLIAFTPFPSAHPCDSTSVVKRQWNAKYEAQLDNTPIVTIMTYLTQWRIPMIKLFICMQIKQKRSDIYINFPYKR